MSDKSNKPILIVGGGPTGLALGIALRRAGVPFRLIDKASGRPDTSRALALHARTLELLDCFGIVEPFLARGLKVKGLGFFENGKAIGEVHLNGIPSSHPYALMLPQSDTEQILTSVLEEGGDSVERSAELLDLRVGKDRTICKIRDAESVVREEEYEYVVGCDGAHSTVRHALGIPFIGGAYPVIYGLADVAVEGNIAMDRLTLFFHKAGPLVFFPLRDGFGRIVAKLDEGSGGEGISFEELQEVVAERTDKAFSISSPEWITSFRTHHRRAERFRVGSVFLAGDAAHIHSPFGGQGMNTGIQDAINLGWKIAAVLQGHSPRSLPGTYAEEREPIADHVLQITDRMVRFSDRPEAAGIRKIALGLLGKAEPLETTLAKQISQISIAYRTSPLSHDSRLPLPLSKQPRAGDRLPDVELVGPGGTRSRLYEMVRQPGFHLFLAPKTAKQFGSHSFGEAKTFAEEIADDLRTDLRIHWLLTPAQSTALQHKLPEHWVDLGGAVSHALGIQPCGAVLVRPDYYIAFGSHDFDHAQLRLSLLSYWIE